MEDVVKLSQLMQRYNELCHAMQSGVASMPRSKDQEPKHLRVGVNSAMVQHSGLVQLLIKKGVMTEVEYWEAMVSAMDAEVLRYRQIVADMNGLELSQVHLA